MAERLNQPPPPSKELKQFTNRHSESAVFRRALEKPALPLPVLIFYGVGGSGKSWLLKRLALEVPPEVPQARLDFANEKYHHDSAAALAAVRRGFDAVDCYRFDNAFGWLRAKQGVADDPAVRGAGAAGAVWEALREGGDALLSDLPGSNIGTWLAEKLAGPAWNRLEGSPAGRRLLSLC